MAQEFDKPFDSPAILVVGHQTDGKSALVEVYRVGASLTPRLESAPRFQKFNLMEEKFTFNLNLIF